MTGTEVMALIREKEGRLCGRYYRRNDGTMLTADCPVGLASRASRRMKSLAFAGMLTVMGALGATTYAGAVTSRRQESQHPSRIAIELDRMVWRMKVWLGFRQPVAVAGGICAPPVKAVTTVAPVSAPK